MKRCTLLAAFVLCVTMAAIAQLRMPNIFGDHMVLQQKSDVTIWGWTGPVEELTIKASWDQQEVKVKSLNTGKWKTKLKTPAAGGPYTITIKGRGELVLNDVMIGEVWLCSGQSNMEWSMTSSAEGAAEIPQANVPEIRLFQINKSAAEYPQTRGEGQWVVCTAETVKAFSAVAYFFGKKVNAEMKVPVGLINASWGGSPAEVWTQKERVWSDAQLMQSALKQKNEPWAPRDPGVVYNSMILPIAPFGIAGVIWYQGESNTVAPATYARLMRSMITGWRTIFEKQFPFYYVQIAPFRYGSPYQGVLIREQQAQLLSVPGTGMVVVSDLVDDVGDIHPPKKKPVGERLANYALAETYKVPRIGYQSPTYKSMVVEKGKIRISFNYGEIGLISHGGDPTQFEIAGEDRKFYPAVAKIEGSTVVVSAKEVKVPVAARYCWDNVAIPNMFNKEGLPVTSFRTDDWEMEMSKVEAKK